MSKGQETKDAELVTLAALVFQDAVLMSGANDLRKNQGYSPAYGDGGEKTGRGSPGEWDKYEDFVDHRISSSFRHGFSRIRVE